MPLFVAYFSDFQHVNEWIKKDEWMKARIMDWQ